MNKVQKPDQQIAPLRVIAVPNGSGKSSYYYQLKNEVDTGVWKNADELNEQLYQKGYFDFDKLSYFPAKKNWLSYKVEKRHTIYCSF
jgi:hypothetical protein